MINMVAVSSVVTFTMRFISNVFKTPCTALEHFNLNANLSQTLNFSATMTSELSRISLHCWKSVTEFAENYMTYDNKSMLYTQKRWKMIGK